MLVYLASLDSGAQGGLCLPLSIFEGPPVLSETLQQKKKTLITWEKMSVCSKINIEIGRVVKSSSVSPPICILLRRDSFGAIMVNPSELGDRKSLFGIKWAVDTAKLQYFFSVCIT